MGTGQTDSSTTLVLAWEGGSAEAGQGQMSGFGLSCLRGDKVVKPGAQGAPLPPEQEQSWADVLIHLVHMRNPVFANTELMLCGAPCVMDKTSQPTSRSCMDLL